VTKIRFQVLIRAATRNDADPVIAAHLYRILRDAGHARSKAGLGTHHAMHPDMLDAQVHTLLDNLFGYLGIGKDETASGFSGMDFKSG